METLAKTRKVGGSLVVTLPREIVREENIKEGERLIIEVKKPKKDFFGALKGIGHFIEKDELKGQLEE